MKYVLGFFFNLSKDEVLLIEKSRPEWQRGMLNGIGGRIELYETPKEAMERKFEDETGVTKKITWREYGTLIGEDYTIYLFFALGDYSEPDFNFDEKRMAYNSEPVVICQTKNLPKHVIPNVRWMIPMAIYDHEYYDIKCN